MNDWAGTPTPYRFPTWIRDSRPGRAISNLPTRFGFEMYVPGLAANVGPPSLEMTGTLVVPQNWKPAYGSAETRRLVGTRGAGTFTV
ncbi:hypothetical protein Pflav_029290 [Phytohabitans flavus]|uniref:Uncharacterized protein n=1 Tax=Phytohabitans flavus TaxID=1076124 RepID=A0A6F8XRV5_9ACTN|nr:hypothetical protein [Phytohabitans flavus]BCB76519.1 hypothetical protein Pflav_029290 [Phytohabitans flavus]